jgi:hypothetical protein
LIDRQSTCIPLGEVRRLANPGNIPLEVIEAQSGNYLDEDDIMRFEDYQDHYGRMRKVTTRKSYVVVHRGMVGSATPPSSATLASTHGSCHA